MVAVNSLYTQSKWLEGGDQKGIFLWGKKKKERKNYIAILTMPTWPHEKDSNGIWKT